MERVLILGNAGSGKSTLARAIGAARGMPVIHLDQHYWQPGWAPPDPVAFAAAVADLAAGLRWVIDGNYSSTFAPRLARADLALFLDMPTWLCLMRVLARRVRWHGRARPDAAPGCPEKIDAVFLRYVARYRREHGERHLRLARVALGERVRVLSGPRAVAAFMRTLRDFPPPP